MKYQFAKLERWTGRVVMGFASVVALVVVAIIYLSFSKTLILITVKPQTISAAATITAKEGAAENGDGSDASPLDARFLTVAVSDELTSTTEGLPGELMDAKATGRVTIYNKYDKMQPLVATTRLQTSEGVLFRTKDTVRVPAGGSVEVDIEADQPGIAGEIGPSRFTIVALWTGLQDQIYAESKTPMTGGRISKKIITLESITQAKQTLQAQILESATAQITHEAEANVPHLTFYPDAVHRSILSEFSSVDAGEEASSFSVSMNIAVTAILLPKSEMDLAFQKALDEQLPDHMKFEDGAPLAKIAVKELDSKTKTARLTLQAEKAARPTLAAPLFDRRSIVNADKQTIRAYFLDFEEVEEVEVKFQPFWVVRAPSLADHIEIRLAD